MSERLNLYRQAVALKENQQYDEAVALLEKVIPQDENDTVPMHALVQCLTELGRHAEAIEIGKKITAIEPDDYFSYVCLSRAYQRGGFIPEAEYAMMQGQQAQLRAQQNARPPQPPK